MLADLGEHFFYTYPYVPRRISMKTLLFSLMLVGPFSLQAAGGYSPNTGASAPGNFVSPDAKEDVIPESKEMSAEGGSPSREAGMIPGTQTSAEKMNTAPTPVQAEEAESDSFDKTLEGKRQSQEDLNSTNIDTEEIEEDEYAEPELDD